MAAEGAPRYHRGTMSLRHLTGAASCALPLLVLAFVSGCCCRGGSAGSGHDALGEHPTDADEHPTDADEQSPDADEQRPDADEQRPRDASHESDGPRRPIPPPTFVPAPPRLIAIGDLHGDLHATRGALRLGRAIDGSDRWIGGRLVVVQVGDQTDRGDDEREVLALLEDLAHQAHAAGGALYYLLGNHEVMNVELDFRYVTPEGWTDFADIPHDPADPRLDEFPAERRGRIAAFLPGGPYATLLAGQNVVMVVGDTAFVHGGLLPAHVSYGLERINGQTRRWMLGEIDEPPVLMGADSPVWDRTFSEPFVPEDCDLLAAVLTSLSVQRLVVAHTVQRSGINTACDAQVWRIDVGLADYYGGPTEVLQIQDGQVTVIRE